MFAAIENQRLLAAYARAQEDLLSERTSGGHWVGELSTSPFSTAAAVSALAIVERYDATTPAGHFANELRDSFLSELIIGGINWLADHQNADGGWGDTDKSHSNIAATMLAVAAFHLTGVPAAHAGVLEAAEGYIRTHGGVSGLKRYYGRDGAFAAPVLVNCALAEMVPWSQVPPLPFELACLPPKWYRYFNLPAANHVMPGLIALGLARFHHRKPWNPLFTWLRKNRVEESLQKLREFQSPRGGFLEAVPLTSFIVMSLASTGRVKDPIVQSGLEFLVESVREDGSWPIDTDMATWNTSLAVNALGSAGEDVSKLRCWDWLLECQHQEPHRQSEVASGGWSWSDLTGAVPDTDDTACALIALRRNYQAENTNNKYHARISAAAKQGVTWLLDLQNSDGGWPTCCRGWGKFPLDRSGADLTAHALRALLAWREFGETSRIDGALRRGFTFLRKQQRPDGSFVPQWFGNQENPKAENPVYGTARVLRAYCDLFAAGQGEQIPGSPEVVVDGAVQWLLAHQNKDGGWGGGRVEVQQGKRRRQEIASSVEETALAVDALFALEAIEVFRSGLAAPSLQRSAVSGVNWLVRAVEENRHKVPSPIGFYFAKLWYYEKLYPLTFTVSALGRAALQLVPPTERSRDVSQLAHSATR